MVAAAWEELVATALLGTERRPPPRPAHLEGALAAALDGLPWDDAEAALLGAAGLVAGYSAAGWQPLSGEQGPAPAPPEQRPLCSAGAGAILTLLLDGDPAHPGHRAVLVPEWLRLARAAGVRPAPEHLPDLLDVAVSRSLRLAVLHVGGERLRWLAALDERWAWAAGGAAAGAAVAERWATGTRDERLALLGALRAEDPARGRELVASTWAQEGAGERLATLMALETGIEAADEQFLEAALDDRSKGVRKQAADLLARLPGSALSARMAARLAPLVAVGGRLRRRLEVQVPPDPGPAAIRDGITDADRLAQFGVGAWRLMQIVGATPLEFWRDLTDRGAAGTLALARGADHAPALRQGWRLAAMRQRDPEWCLLLARETADAGLLSALAPGAGDEVAIWLLGQATDTNAAARLVESVPAPWSPRLSRAAIDRLASVFLPGAAAGGWQYGRLDAMALALDLSTAGAAAAAFEPLLQSDLQPAVRGLLDELLSILDLRQAMTRELTRR